MKFCFRALFGALLAFSHFALRGETSCGRSTRPGEVGRVIVLGEMAAELLGRVCRKYSPGGFWPIIFPRGDLAEYLPGGDGREIDVYQVPQSQPAKFLRQFLANEISLCQSD